MKNNLLYLSMLLFAVMFITSCSEDNNKSNVKSGKLAGTQWVQKDTYSSTVFANDYTYTLKFTSDKEGIATQTGWFQVIDAKTWKLKPKENVNRTQNFTYIYSPELQEGVFTCSTGGIYKKGDHIFSISSSFTELNMGNASYKLQQ